MILFKLLKLKHWQIFLVLFPLLIFLFDIMEPYISVEINSSYNENIDLFLLIIAIFTLMIFIYISWIYLLGLFLAKLYTKKFKILININSILFFLSVVTGRIITGNNSNFLINNSFYWVIEFFSVLSFITGPVIITYLLQKFSDEFDNYALTFFAVTFYIVGGIFYLQNGINRIYRKYEKGEIQFKN